MIYETDGNTYQQKSTSYEIYFISKKNESLEVKFPVETFDKKSLEGKLRSELELKINTWRFKEDAAKYN